MLVLAAMSLGACSPNLAGDFTGLGDHRPKSDGTFGTTEVVGSVTAVRATGRDISYTGSGSFMSQATSSPEASTRSEGDAVTLNLAGVSIPNAAKVVLGDILGFNYSVADKLPGTITIQSAAPMPKSAVLEAFEQALKMNGAVLVNGGGHFNILPATDIGNAPMALASRIRRDKAGMQLLVVPLRFATASEMQRVLEPVSPKGSIVKADDTRNLLFLAGSAKELSNATEMVKLFDVDWMRGMSVALQNIHSADPEAIVRDVEPMLGIDRDGPQKGAVRLLPNRRLQAIMIITSKPHLLRRAKQVIKEIDRVAVNTEEQVFVHKVRNRSATELAQLLSKVLSGGKDQGATGSLAPRVEPATLIGGPSADPVKSGGLSTVMNSSAAKSAVDTTPVTPPNAGSAGAAAAPKGGIDLNTGGPVLGGAPDEGHANGGQASSRGTKIIPDEANHSLLITATRREFDRIEKILDRIDVAPRQVMLEAMIAEVTLNDDLRFGVKWAAAHGKLRFTDLLSGIVDSQFPGFSYVLGSKTGSFGAVIDALSARTKVNVVSAPSLMVRESRKALLQIGDQVPIVTQQAQPVIAGAISPVINSVTLKDTGVILSVTPTVAEKGQVVLEIEQEVSSAIRTQSSGIDSPTIQQRRVRTSVIVNDGDVVTLGGMIQERDTKSKTQIPILGDIPVIGTAFRVKNDNISRTELLIFIRPLVISNKQDAQDVTEEFRKRLNIEQPTTKSGRNIYERDLRRSFQ